MIIVLSLNILFHSNILFSNFLIHAFDHLNIQQKTCAILVFLLEILINSFNLLQIVLALPYLPHQIPDSFHDMFLNGLFHLYFGLSDLF